MELPWPPGVETALFDPSLLSGFGLLTLEPQGLLSHLPGVTSALFSHSFASGKTAFSLSSHSYSFFDPLLSDCYFISPGQLGSC